MNRLIIILSLVVISAYAHAQPQDTSEDKNFDYLLAGGNEPIGCNFPDEKSKHKYLALFMHRAKQLNIKFFLIRNDKDSLVLAFRYTKQGDVYTVINSAGGISFHADKTGWTIIVGYQKDERHFTENGDLIIKGIGYWFYPTVDP